MPRPKKYKPSKNESQKSAAPVAATATANNAVDGGHARRKKGKRSFKQAKETVGIVVSDDLQVAIDRCKSKVENIAEMCRARNRKFR
jgi:hypothetical protein